MVTPVSQGGRRGRKPKASLFDPPAPDAESPPEGEQEGTAKPQDAPSRDAFPPPTETSEALFAPNMGLACMLARRAASQTRLPFDALQSAAYVGLLRACRKYDPTLINKRTGEPYKFSSLAYRFIEGEIGHMLRNNHTSGVRFPERWRDRAPKIRRLIGQGLTPEAVAEETGFSANEVREIVEAQSATHEINLDYQPYHDTAMDISEDGLDCEQYIKSLEIADKAWLALDCGDQSIMARAWQGFGTKAARREIAQRPYDRLAKFATAVARGQSLPRGVRQPALDLVFEEGGERKTVSGSVQIIGHLEQQVLNITIDD
jgi:DNA-directed RNA polymerase specialized sigma subunit